jgi:hypothetical protein
MRQKLSDLGITFSSVRTPGTRYGRDAGNSLRFLALAMMITCLCTSPLMAQQSDDFAMQPSYYGSIPYLSGGVGLDEREELSQVARNYNLKLTFAVTAGNYLSNVSVQIHNATGRLVLEAVSDGPWFFAQLPVGRYTVIVNVMGATQQQSVQVSGRGQSQLNFLWK